MLIASRRHTPGDLRHWSMLEGFDRQIYATAAMRRLIDDARRALDEFFAGGAGYVSVSWGKDSVVVAHLATEMIGADLPVVWFPAGSIENPDCALVRDAFLARYPCAYAERPAVLPDDDWNRHLGHDGAQEAFEEASREFGHRYASGVRAEESSTRRMTMRVNSLVSRNTCRPIGWWKTEHVFAYLAGNDLPVHPAYACTMEGRLDRNDLRVSTLGGKRGRGHGRAEWERRYYRAEMAAIEGRR